MATNENFYQIIELIPAGTVATYGQVAAWAGSPSAAMAVGNALRNRPTDRPLPWQRVINGDCRRGTLSPSAPAAQRELLKDEGIRFAPDGSIDLEQFGWGGPAAGDEVDDEVGVPDVPPSAELASLTDADVLKKYAEVMQEIKRRGLSKGMNNPIADYAELLVATALKAERMPQSNTGFDLKGLGDIRYEVKARRLASPKGSRQLSAIRNLKDRHFDFLVGVLFNQDFTVYRAAIVPWEIVRDKATFKPHTNGWNFHLRDDVWGLPGVKNLTL